MSQRFLVSSVLAYNPDVLVKNFPVLPLKIQTGF